LGVGRCVFLGGCLGVDGEGELGAADDKAEALGKQLGIPPLSSYRERRVDCAHPPGVALAQDGESVLGDTLVLKPHVIVRVAADACHSLQKRQRAPYTIRTEHEKGGHLD
jgi:hypothetical protein